jgi:hypothetical protein
LSWIEQVVRQWLVKRHYELIQQNQAKIRALTKG